MTEVSVVLPTFNEAETIRPAISSVRAALADVDHEVIIVDDNSPDGTAEIVEDVYGSGSRVCVIKRMDESGLASAVLDGFDAADGDALVCMDADLQHPPERVVNLLAHLETGADMAICSRHVDGGGIDGNWPIHRRVVSTGATLLSRLLVPTARQLSDPMSGYFAVQRELVEGVRHKLDPTGYKIALEILARAPVREVHEVPFTFRERAGGSSNLGPREYVRYVHHLARLSIPDRASPSTTVEEVSASVVDD